MYDLARCDMSDAVADAFRYSKLVLATTTYNADIFPFMREYIEHLTERNFCKRTVGLIENGSWAPMAAKVMRSLFEKSKDINFCENTVKILSALNEESTAQLNALAEELTASPAPAEETAEEAKSSKRYICKICGYVHEGELSDDFICPLCKKDASFFEEEKPQEAKRYICKICGYVHEGELSDDFICPLCKKDASFFEEEKPQEAKRYICKICGYVHEGELSDDFICPLCKKDASFFEETK